MRDPFRLATLTLFASLSVPCYVESQDASILLGLVSDDATVNPAFSWNGTAWQTRAREIPVGTAAVVVDSLGRRFSATFGEPLSGFTPFFHLNGIDELIDRDRRPFYPPQTVAYATSPGIDHSPFLRAESPLSIAEWDSLLTSVRPSGDSAIPNELDIRVWSARTGDQALTYFVVSRRPNTRECRDRHQFTGWFPSGTSEPVIASSSSGDCDGKGLDTRRPYALLVPEGGPPALAISIHDWETSGIELWELVDGQLHLRGTHWDS